MPTLRPSALFVLLTLAASYSIAVPMPQDNVTPAPELTSKASPDASQRQRVVIVQPVVLHDDDGSNAAPLSLPKQLVDRVYTKADVEFLYLPTRHWNYGEGRRGEVNLNTIVAAGHKNGMICKDPRIETLLFVSSVDGQEGPLGRGLQNGNVCFVCLGPTPDQNDPAMEAFVVAHEVGHCLNLKHSVDDPRVPNDLINLQGDGPFDQRLAIDGLHDTQRDTVLASPLVNERIRFLARDEAARQLVDETWEPYLSNAHPDMLRFVLGLTPSTNLPKGAKAQLQFARQEHGDFAAEFTEEERELLRERVTELQRLVGGDWPLLTRLPWNFIKVNDGFCRGMPHTRGLSTVLGPRALAKIKSDPTYALTLLLHEKLHVVERISPEVFEALYRSYGFQPIEMDPASVASLNLAQNPDALSLNWAIPVDGSLCLLATTIAPEGDELVFVEKLRTLEKQPSGLFTAGSEVDLEKLDEFKQRFAVRTGHDHPNEIAAYLAEHLLRTDYLGLEIETTAAAAPQVEATRAAFKKILGDIGPR
ncbi:MAG: hypothetical protein VCB43_00455 [Myxococcota bacterium]